MATGGAYHRHHEQENLWATRVRNGKYMSVYRPKDLSSGSFLYRNSDLYHRTLSKRRQKYLPLRSELWYYGIFKHSNDNNATRLRLTSEPEFHLFQVEEGAAWQTLRLSGKWWLRWRSIPLFATWRGYINKIFLIAQGIRNVEDTKICWEMLKNAAHISRLKLMSVFSFDAAEENV